MLHNPFQAHQGDPALQQPSKALLHKHNIYLQHLLHNHQNQESLNPAHQTAATESVTRPIPVPDRGPNTTLTPPSQPPPSPARHHFPDFDHRCRIILKSMISPTSVPPPTTSLPSVTLPPLRPNRGDARSMAKM